MRDSTKNAVFVTVMNSPAEMTQTRLLIKSLRAFGGVLRHSPVWIFTTWPSTDVLGDFVDNHIQLYTLEMPESVKNYWFGHKVYACHQAEKIAYPGIQSLIWFSHDCLIIHPPLLLHLDHQVDAAFRPVHGINIGLKTDEPVDYFWQVIYDRVQLYENHITVESYVDDQHIRAYFNSHIFSWNSATGLAQKWFEVFEDLVANNEYQARACQDIPHRVFLHQAVLSALVEKLISPDRLRILPPDYSYPYNMQSLVPVERRANTLNNLVCIAYEDRPLHPSRVQDIVINEPLKGWLAQQLKYIEEN